MAISNSHGQMTRHPLSMSHGYRQERFCGVPRALCSSMKINFWRCPRPWYPITTSMAWQSLFTLSGWTITGHRHSGPPIIWKMTMSSMSTATAHIRCISRLGTGTIARPHTVSMLVMPTDKIGFCATSGSPTARSAEASIFTPKEEMKQYHLGALGTPFLPAH